MYIRKVEAHKVTRIPTRAAGVWDKKLLYFPYESDWHMCPNWTLVHWGEYRSDYGKLPQRVVFCQTSDERGMCTILEVE